MGRDGTRSWRCFDRWCGALLLAVCLLWSSPHMRPTGTAGSRRAGRRRGGRRDRGAGSPARCRPPARRPLAACAGFAGAEHAGIQTILRNDAATLVLGLSRDGWEKTSASVGGGQKSGKAWIGVRVGRCRAGRNRTGTPGALITGVSPDGPAAQAGLKAGDVVTRLEDVRSMARPPLASLLEDWPNGRSMRLAVTREGWGATSSSRRPARRPPRSRHRRRRRLRCARSCRLDRSAAGIGSAPRAATSAGPPQGNKALVAIGDFKVRAATANQAIGDGAAGNAGHRAPPLRQLRGRRAHDIQGLAAEQALSRSRMAREGSAVPEHQMEVADIIVYGAVTEFEGAARGSSCRRPCPSPCQLRPRFQYRAHGDRRPRGRCRVGRVLGSQSVVGDASSSQTAVSERRPYAALAFPPVWACFPHADGTGDPQLRREAVGYVSATVPPGYFRHR